MGLLTFRWPEEAHGTREVERERPRRCARQSRLQARIGVFALGIIVVVVALVHFEIVQMGTSKNRRILRFVKEHKDYKLN